VLPRINRMRRSVDFQRAVRHGRRTSATTLVVHSVGRVPPGPALVGFVVSKAVGNAVLRNQVKRRLRSAVRPHLESIGSSLVVIRAKPTAGAADFPDLAGDLEHCLSRIVGVQC
jgi:ribonuclease P protein component